MIMASVRVNPRSCGFLVASFIEPLRFAGVPAQLQRTQPCSGPSLRPGVPGVAPMALQAGSHVAVPQAVAMRVGSPQEPQATQASPGLPAGPKIPETADQSTAPQPAVPAVPAVPAMPAVPAVPALSTVEAPAAVQGVQGSQVQVMHFHGDPEVSPAQAQGVSEQSQSLTLSQPAQFGSLVFFLGERSAVGARHSRKCEAIAYTCCFCPESTIVYNTYSTHILLI